MIHRTIRPLFFCSLFGLTLSMTGCDNQKQIAAERSRASNQLQATVNDLNQQHFNELQTALKAAVAETELRVRKELAEEAKLATEEAFQQGKLIGEQAEKNNYIEQGISQGKVIGEALGFQRGQDSGRTAEAARGKEQLELMKQNFQLEQAAVTDKEFERGRIQGQLEGASQSQSVLFLVVAIIAVTVFVSLKSWWKVELDRMRQAEREEYQRYVDDNNRRFGGVLDQVFQRLLPPDPRAERVG